MLLPSWRALMKITGSVFGSGSVSQRYGSADPDSYHNVTRIPNTRNNDYEVDDHSNSLSSGARHSLTRKRACHGMRFEKCMRNWFVFLECDQEITWWKNLIFPYSHGCVAHRSAIGFWKVKNYLWKNLYSIEQWDEYTPVFPDPVDQLRIDSWNCYSELRIRIRK